MTINEFFRLGMKRDIPYLITPGVSMLNLGAGNSFIPGAINIDYPEWDASIFSIPASDEFYDTIYALHFLEHFTGERVIELLREIERVLRPGGTANIITPHRLGMIAYQDLDHKCFFTEETWRTLFDNKYYDKNREKPWKLKVHTCFIMGLVERNLALMTQLVKI